MMTDAQPLDLHFKALSQLVEKHVQRRLGHYASPLQEDARQDIWLNILELNAIHKPLTTGDLIRLFERHSRRVKRSVAQDRFRNISTEHFPTDSRPDRVLATRRASLELKQCLEHLFPSTLTHTQRRVLHSRLCQEHTIQQSAITLGLTTHTIKNETSRGLRRLAEQACEQLQPLNRVLGSRVSVHIARDVLSACDNE